MMCVLVTGSFLSIAWQNSKQPTEQLIVPPALHNRVHRSAAVPRALEVEEEVQDAPVKGGAEAVLACVVPLLVDDAEGNVLVRWPRLQRTRREQAEGSAHIGVSFLILQVHNTLAAT
jgi:hypothetical protein